MTVKKSLLGVGLVLTAMWVSGCIVICGKGRCSTEVVIHQADRATVEEIRAVAKLDFEPSKLEAYKRIAERPGLSDAAQVTLVEESLRRLDFEPGKMEILLAVVKNPSFSDAGERAMLRNLDRLDFEPSKAAILEAIAARKAGGPKAVDSR